MQQARKPKGTPQGGQFDGAPGGGSGDLPALGPQGFDTYDGAEAFVEAEIGSAGLDPLDYDVAGVTRDCFPKKGGRYSARMDEEGLLDSIASHDLGRASWDPSVDMQGSYDDAEKAVRAEMEASGQNPERYDVDAIIGDCWMQSDDGYTGVANGRAVYEDVKRSRSWRHILGHATRLEAVDPDGSTRSTTLGQVYGSVNGDDGPYSFRVTYVEDYGQDHVDVWPGQLTQGLSMDGGAFDRSPLRG